MSKAKLDVGSMRKTKNSMMSSSLSIVFPAYNDEKTIGVLVEDAQKLLPTLVKNFEIIVVNDGSSDATGRVLKNLQQKISHLRVITHKKNKGYGAAIVSGFQNTTKELIFYTDGDGQYDIFELKKLIAVFDEDVDMVTGYKLRRSDSMVRKILGGGYNTLMKTVFGIPIRDIDCDFRLFRRSVLKNIKLSITSGAFDAQFIQELHKKHVRFKEVGVHHYKRPYGKSQVFRPVHLYRSAKDAIRLLVNRV